MPRAEKYALPGDARPLNAEHLRQKFLGEWQALTSGKVRCPQQPTGEPRFDVVRCYARRRLLGLGIKGLLVADQRLNQATALKSCGRQAVDTAGDRFAG